MPYKSLGGLDGSGLVLFANKRSGFQDEEVLNGRYCGSIVGLFMDKMSILKENLEGKELNAELIETTNEVLKKPSTTAFITKAELHCTKLF